MRAKRKAKRANSYARNRLSATQGYALLEQAAGALGMTATTFVRRFKQRRIPDPDRPEVLRAVALLPFAR